jgi:hypothetical protein
VAERLPQPTNRNMVQIFMPELVLPVAKKVTAVASQLAKKAEIGRANLVQSAGVCRAVASLTKTDSSFALALSK